jgi:hypothetical protein
MVWVRILTKNRSIRRWLAFFASRFMWAGAASLYGGLRFSGLFLGFLILFWAADRFPSLQPPTE